MRVWTSNVNPSTPSFQHTKVQQLESLGRLEKIWQEALREGEEATLSRHRKNGKYPARERIDRTLDPGSFFVELMPFAGHGQTGAQTGASLVVGLGLVSRKLCLLVANVPTIKGGAINKWTLQKMLRASEIADQCHLPLVYFIESAGADLTQQSDIYNMGGAEFREITRRSKKGLPTLAIVFGNSTAGGAYIPGMSDYVVMVKKNAQVFLAGPPLVKMAINEDVDAETLGGAQMHATLSGLADFVAENEEEAFSLARDIVSTWEVNFELPLASGTVTEPIYPAEDLLGLLPMDIRQQFEMREVIARLVDGSRFLDFKSLFGPTLVTVFAEIGGERVGILGNNGVIHPDSADKGSQFIQLCNQRNIPLLFLQNVTGFMVGAEAERQGIIRAGAALINAVSNSEMPAVTIIIGASYGAGNYGMCGRAYQPRFLFSLPHAKLAVMGPEQLSGVLTLLKQDRLRTASPEEVQKIEESQNQLRQQVNHESDAFFGSGRVWDDGVLDPRHLRSVLKLCFKIVKPKINKAKGAYGVFR